MIKEAGPDGVSKVVEKFVGNHPNFAKRQVELKISEIAIKEKRTNDSKLVWYILPQYEHFLEMENFEENAAIADKSDATAMETEDKKRKRSIGDNMSSPESKPKQKVTKPSSEDKQTSQSSASGEPKKYKRAFAWFVKEKRPEAEKVAKNPEVLLHIKLYFIYVNSHTNKYRMTYF